MTASIRSADRILIQNILQKALPHNSHIWVFGSRACGETKRSSDLDLAIDAGRPLTRQEILALYDAFEDSDLPYSVDFVDTYTIRDSFKNIINAQKTPLF